MQLSQIKSKHYRPSKKRIGRGGKSGTYAGRGLKGQKARSGTKFEPMIRPLIKRYHKLKGIGFHPNRQLVLVVSLGKIASGFKEGEVVTPESLKEKGLISPKPGVKLRVKILSSEKFSKKLVFENCQFSQRAKEQIEKLGGQIKN